MKSSIKDDKVVFEFFIGDIDEDIISLLSSIEIANKSKASKEIFKEDYLLCKDIDENDTPFVAVSIFLNAKLLTGDKKLKNSLKNKGFEIIGIDDVF